MGRCSHALGMGSLFDVAERRLPSGTGELARTGECLGVDVLADDPRSDVAEPVAGGPEILVARGDRDRTCRAELRACGDEVVPGLWWFDPGLGQKRLVVPEHVGDIGRIRDHHDLAVEAEALQRLVGEETLERAGRELLGDVGDVAILLALLQALTGPLEVDVRCVPAREQVLQADRLVQIVLLVVHLDLGLGVRGHVLLGDVIPDADLGFARRPHRDPEDVVVLGLLPAPTARSQDQCRAGADERQSGRHTVHRFPPPWFANRLPGLVYVEVTSARNMSSTSPKTRTRRSRNSARYGTSVAVIACWSPGNRPSIASSAARHMALAPSSNASIQGRHSCKTEGFETSPRSR